VSAQSKSPSVIKKSMTTSDPLSGAGLCLPPSRRRIGQLRGLGEAEQPSPIEQVRVDVVG